MAEAPENLMEVRQDQMVSPKGGNPHQKTAHFIKPVLGSTHKPPPERPFISLPFKPILQKVTFNGWRNPTQQWVSWVDRLHSSYKCIWQRAGIYEAILSSRYKVVRNEELFFGLAERWCSETNTFVFPWGEASFTLEDVVILGGYSVLGDSVSGSAGDEEFVEIEKKLMSVHLDLSRGKAQKANQSQWMKHFMASGGGGGDNGVEHEAFLSLWLSRFVLPTYPFNIISKRFFKIAIHLARGTRIALAPVVLASIYRDLTLLKTGMEGVEKQDEFDDLVMVTLWAPLQLVQVWAWERFPECRPNPRGIECGEPRMGRWHEVNEKEVGNVRPMLQSAGDTFVWRPYCERVENWCFPTFYRENDEWFLVDYDHMGDDIQALVRFWKVCELVGMDSVEQYNPHRVAMQFGFDQDVPVHVSRWMVSPDIPKRQAMQFAWLSYTNPIKDPIVFVPSRFYESKVTVRYLEWHRQGYFTRVAKFDNVVTRKRSSKQSRRSPVVKKGKFFADDEIDVPPAFTLENVVDHCQDKPPGFLQKSVGNNSDVPPGFLSTNIGNDFDMPSGFLAKPDRGASLDKKIVDRSLDVPPGFVPKNVGNDCDLPPGFLPKNVGINCDVPPGFPPKPNRASSLEVSDKNANCLHVKVKEEELNKVKQMLKCTSNQSMYTSPCKIVSRREGISSARAGRIAVKSEPMMCRFEVETKQTGAHGVEEQIKNLELEDRLCRLEREIAALREEKSARASSRSRPPDSPSSMRGESTSEHCPS